MCSAFARGKEMKNEKLEHFLNIMIPAVIFGGITGVITAVVINLYKFLAGKIISLSEEAYHLLADNLWALLLVVPLLLGVAYLVSLAHKRWPNIKGGGIPTSIGILRGAINFKWLSTLIGTFFASLVSFFIGVPLGNEGPSVQMGTAIGNGAIPRKLKKYKAWRRYTMTGGACSGFAVATGAPISGVLFAIEEAHQRISPMIFMVAAVSVSASYLTTSLLAPILGVSVSLFPSLTLISLGAKDTWIPLVVGAVLGFFAVAFLKFYELISGVMTTKLVKIPALIKIFVIFAVTLIFGLISHSFISTGHHLIVDLLLHREVIYMLVLILLVRMALTVFANTSGLTGGVFLPIMAIGALVSALLGEVALWLGLDEKYYTVILVLGIVACVAGMMKMPLTAIVFAIEALSSFDNIIFVVITSVVAFMITEIFEVKSVGDSVLEHRIHGLYQGKQAKVIDTFVTVEENSFAVGKQIRDILWPANLFVLSLKRGEEGATVDQHGGAEMHAGDILHVRYSTLDEEATREELMAIVNEQDYDIHEDKVI